MNKVSVGLVDHTVFIYRFDPFPSLSLLVQLPLLQDPPHDFARVDARELVLADLLEYSELLCFGVPVAVSAGSRGTCRGGE